MMRAPVMVAWGAGVDSTAMIIELIARGEPIDMVLFADPGSEKADTYALIPVFREWMRRHAVLSEIVRYQPRKFKHWPPYATIAENMLTNATLPSVVFRSGSCSRITSATEFVQGCGKLVVHQMHREHPDMTIAAIWMASCTAHY